jgi:hypothetical protein
MNGTMGCAVLMAAVMAFAPLQVEAQTGARGQRGMRGQNPPPGIERLMRLGERLDLNDGQMGQLETLRAEVVQHRTRQQALMTDLRSRVMAGQLGPAEAREQMAASHESAGAFADDMRTRVEAILTDEQRAEVENLAGQARAFARGRASASRGRGQAGMRSRAGTRGSRGWNRTRMPRRPGRMMRRPDRGFGFGPGSPVPRNRVPPLLPVR